MRHYLCSNPDCPLRAFYLFLRRLVGSGEVEWGGGVGRSAIGHRFGVTARCLEGSIRKKKKLSIPQIEGERRTAGSKSDWAGACVSYSNMARDSGHPRSEVSFGTQRTHERRTPKSHFLRQDM